LTAVYVTHDKEEAFSLCDRIAVMVGGKLMQTGAPRELYEQPADIAVARFLGRNNLIRAMRLSSSNTSEGEFTTLDGGHTLHMPIARNGLAPLNKPVVLAIRPEHVRLTANDGAVPNALRGMIREIVFAGATSTVRVDANGLLLEALVVQPDGLQVGEECAVILDPDKLRLLRQG
jgi:ABC-type Fe3+/spermidine/putrescine transport system ATPase subunit